MAIFTTPLRISKKNFKEASDVLLSAFEVQKKQRRYFVVYTTIKIANADYTRRPVFRTKNYERSDSSYEAALEIDPNNATVLNNYAYYLSERDDKLEKAERMSKNPTCS